MQNVCGLYNVAFFTFLSVERCGPENLVWRHVPRDLLIGHYIRKLICRHIGENRIRCIFRSHAGILFMVTM